MGHAGFLRAICEAPHDDAPRLIYADWLDDHGDEARAEFIRVQCELAWRNPAPALLSNMDELESLRRRERELLEAHRVEWTDIVKGFVTDAWSLDEPVQPYAYGARVRYRRGFVDEVRTMRAAWHTHGAAVVAAAPVTVLVLTDAAPRHLGGKDGYCWYANNASNIIDDPDNVPRDWCDGLRGTLGYTNSDRFIHAGNTSDEALVWLGRRALGWARTQAGLPLLSLEYRR